METLIQVLSKALEGSEEVESFALVEATPGSPPAIGVEMANGEEFFIEIQLP